MKFVAGVFGGGGANGGWQAGRLVALKEAGYEFDLLTGTSVGALNALMEATGQTPLLEGLWTTLFPERILEKGKVHKALLHEALFHIGIGKERKSLHKSIPLRKLLGRLFLNKECLIDYFCSVVVIGDGSPNRYMKHHIPKGHIINNTDLDMVWASTSIPVVFEEVEVNGMKLFDGGVLQSTPIRHTIRHFPIHKIVGVVCQPLGELNVEMGRGLVGRVEWTISAMLRGQFEEEWNGIHHWNQALKQWNDYNITEPLMVDGLPVKYIETDLHAPYRPLGDMLDFDKSKTAIDFYDGYNSYK